jgi:hypothetical protein
LYSKAKELIISQRAILAHWRKQAMMLIDHSECHCAFCAQLLESSYVIHAASSIIRSSCFVDVLESPIVLVFISIRKLNSFPRSPPE